MAKSIAILLTALLLTTNAMAASSLLDYQERVSRGGDEIERVRHSSGDDNDISSIRNILPKSEQVEMNGQTVTVDNAWLHLLLDSYEAERDPQKRLAKLDEASERLYALDEHLRSALEASGGEDADARARIRQILARQEYLEKEEGPLSKLIKQVRQQIIDFLRDLYLRLARALFGQGAEASWLFRGLVIAGLVVTIIIVARMVRRLKRGKKRDKKRTVLGEEIDEGVTSSDLADSAHAAARSGDFRLAVRKLYISLLYELAERNLIELEPQATNREYLARVSRFAPLAQPMHYMTERFDYFWYGMFPSTEQDFSVYLTRYKEALDQVKNLGNQTAAAG